MIYRPLNLHYRIKFLLNVIFNAQERKKNIFFSFIKIYECLFALRGGGERKGVQRNGVHLREKKTILTYLISNIYLALPRVYKT